MRYLPIVFLLASIMAAQAQGATKAFLNGWVSAILDGRAEKAWVPGLYAEPTTAQALGTVAGATVKSDAALPPGMLVIRCESSCPKDNEGVPLPNGSKMASYRGIKL